MKRLLKIFFNDTLELREQLFRNILLLGLLAGVFSIFEALLLGNLGDIVITYILLYIVLALATYFTLRFHKIEISAVLVGVVLSGFVCPMMFFKCGGIRGGATVWFVFSILYLFIMFNGIKLILFLGFSGIMGIACYVIGYRYPDMITPLQSEYAIYLDSVFSVFTVGILSGMMMRTQINMYRRERELTKQQTKELEKAGDYKNTFFANVSHEIRTPLNSIIGLNDMILREEISPKVREYVKNSDVASHMLLSMVNDFLDFSQLELNKMAILKTGYQTKLSVDNLLDVVRVLAEEKKLDFYVDIDKNLPAVMFGDQKRIQQILLNLLSNAIKYTNTGSVILKVTGETVDYKDTPGEVGDPELYETAQKNSNVKLKIIVQDTGVGIRSEDLAHLYESFKRLDEGRNQSSQGTGLGLFITKQLVDLMGGTISVDSIYTKGSTFTIELEQQVIDPKPIVLTESKNDIVIYQQSFEAPEARILIVDDDHISRTVTKDLLLHTKVAVDIAGNGQECLEMAKHTYYHVILMDHMLPDLDGATILKEIRNQEDGLCRDSSVILITANNLSEARRIFQENRFDGYLEKPFTGKALEEEILRFLPDDIVEYRKERLVTESVKTIQRQKRKGICITADSACEVPEELIEKYDIRLMYLYIQTNSGRFADTKEVISNSFRGFLADEWSEIRAVSASVEEYEEFFADVLTDADDVIHISMAANTGVSYKSAVAAAKGFDHVHVIDSGLISGAQGLLVIRTAELAMEGLSAQEILEQIEIAKLNIETRYFMPNPKVFSQKGFMPTFHAGFYEAINAHPVLAMRQSRFTVVGMKFGNLERSKKEFVKNIFRNKRKIDPKVVFISHVGWSEKELMELKQQILKAVSFKQVIIENASVSNACNAGPGVVGIAFFKRVDLERDLL